MDAESTYSADNLIISKHLAGDTWHTNRSLSSALATTRDKKRRFKGIESAKGKEKVSKGHLWFSSIVSSNEKSSQQRATERESITKERAVYRFPLFTPYALCRLLFIVSFGLSYPLLLSTSSKRGQPSGGLPAGGVVE